MNKKENNKVKENNKNIKETKKKYIRKVSILFRCSCTSAVDDFGLIRQSHLLNGSYVQRKRPACGIPVAVQELKAA